MNPKALWSLTYGMYIVCSIKDGKQNGQIANTVIQVAADPPMAAVCINKKNLTHEYISASRLFTASILCEEAPMQLIGRFGFRSGRDIEKLDGVEQKMGTTGVTVVLEHGVAYLEVKVTDEVDVKSHTLFVGEIVDAEAIADKAAMSYAYYHKIKGGKTPANAPSYVKPQ